MTISKLIFTLIMTAIAIGVATAMDAHNRRDLESSAVKHWQAGAHASIVIANAISSGQLKTERDVLKAYDAALEQFRKTLR